LYCIVLARGWSDKRKRLEKLILREERLGYVKKNERKEERSKEETRTKGRIKFCRNEEIVGT
jgi:hypothetical protein